MRDPAIDEDGEQQDTLAPEDSMKPSLLDEELRFLMFKSWLGDDARHSRQWRLEAKEDFEFICPGGQWSTEDKQTLKDQQRVPIEFNRVLIMIKAVAGIEINGRHEINYLPRNTEDAKINELLTGASKWMSDNCDGEDEESEAFQHTLACGMGWTEHRLDFEEEQEGKYLEEAIDPLEMYWDRTAKKKNLADARRLARVRKMPLADAMQLFPGFSRDELDAKWTLGIETDEPQKTLEERRVRDEQYSQQYPDRVEVTIVQIQWWERETYWLIADPATNSRAMLPDDKFKVLQERANMLGLPLQAVKMRRRKYYQAFIGGKVLELGNAPLPDRFSFSCITGQLHHIKRTWFGLVRVMRDPQMWANKWLSQSLHIMNSSAKGGILAEKGAFDDQTQAEESWARNDRITWMAKGALGGANSAPKWAQKPQLQVPQGYIELMEFAVSSLRDAAGINLELLGLKDANQPGVLEAQRKQAGMTVLATMFDALRRSRKQIGRIRLYFIQNFLNDGRLIRIVGPDGAKVVPLLRDKTLGEYDVIVDDTPTSPNQKERNWAIIQPMLAVFKDQLMTRPDVFAIVLDYSPLPQKVVEAIKTALMQPPQKDPQIERLKQIEIADKIAGINQKQSVAELNLKKAGATEATAFYDIAMANNLLAKNNMGIDSLRERLDAEHKLAQIGTEHAKAANIAADTDAKHVGAHAARVGALIDALTPIPHEPPPAKPVTPPVGATAR